MLKFLFLKKDLKWSRQKICKKIAEKFFFGVENFDLKKLDLKYFNNIDHAIDLF